MDSERQGKLLSHIFDALGSLLTSLLVFAATPAVLVTVVGYPLGSGLGHQWDQVARFVLTGVALSAWVAWLACSTQLLRSVISQVRLGHVNAPAGAVLTDRVAARIAAGVFALIAVAAPLLVASGTGASTPSTPTVGMDVGRSTPLPSMAAPLPVTVVPAQGLVSKMYVVHPGDSLWSIAETQLGDGGDWPAIAALNLGRTMPDGLRFIDPSLIHAGWTLQMPDEGGAPSLTPESADAEGPDSPSSALPATPSVASIRPTSVRTTIAGATSVLSAAAAATRHLHTSATPPSALPQPAATAMITPSAGALGTAKSGILGLPELSALGIGALACAALARRSGRMRMLRQMTADEAATWTADSDDVIDTEIMLGRFSGVPALHAFEAANCGLARALTQVELPSRSTLIRAVCVGAAGVDFWLTAPAESAPRGFSLTEDGKVWHAPHDAFTGTEGAQPHLRIVLPIGEDDAGTWLIPLEPGTCLPLVGEAAGDLWRAAQRAQESWAWADMVMITEDPRIVAREVELLSQSEVSTDTLQLLYYGDPTSLSDSQAQMVAIVTQSAALATDITVVVDRSAASLHPLGRTVRPHLMGIETSAVIGELVSNPPRLESDPRHETANDVGRNEMEECSPRQVLQIPTHITQISMPDPGIVQVKLLTATPRLEGLRDELAPNRARRSIELVAYLALHTGDDVTSDRLRTRVLGSSDADAASKTLFNIATAARRAMGADEEGAPLFPPGTKAGIYRVSAGVTVDVLLAGALAAQGSAAEHPDHAMALLRAALTLVEGEPLANALSGYGWWEAEGHGARLAAVLVNAASDLAALATKAGHFELAQWGLGQARLVDPYSEALSRVAMQVAAAAGDADRLRREWRECQRRMDELDPGSSPSLRTERLYGELKQRVLVGAESSASDSSLRRT